MHPPTRGPPPPPLTAPLLIAQPPPPFHFLPSAQAAKIADPAKAVNLPALELSECPVFTLPPPLGWRPLYRVVLLSPPLFIFASLLCASQAKASKELVATAEGGDLQKVLVILALGADIDTRDGVSGAQVYFSRQKVRALRCIPCTFEHNLGLWCSEMWLVMSFGGCARLLELVGVRVRSQFGEQDQDQFA